MSLLISIAALPSVSLATSLAQLVGEFCRLELRDPDLGMRLHLAAHELAENLAKYATASPASLELGLVAKDGSRVLRIQTRNRASPERILDLERRLEVIIDAEDPGAHYQRLLEESIARPGASGLGLARIRAEADLELDYQVDGDQITIVATAAEPHA